jgi:hypothetical protein
MAVIWCSRVWYNSVSVAFYHFTVFDAGHTCRAVWLYFQIIIIVEIIALCKCLHADLVFVGSAAEICGSAVFS